MNTMVLAVKIVLDKWRSSIKNFDDLLLELSDETLLREIVPGKNRGIYLLGHLLAVHDDMLVLLDMGNKLYPQWNDAFLKHADKVISDIPGCAELRQAWIIQAKAIQQKFDALPSEQWFEKHQAISDQDFALEPHRNKLNVVLTRINHLQYHIGQLALLK
ncbi:MAG TPA: DinB family protein [Bacteroidia bacterium]|nr:DinB family protein [Bacteroidia bacterium]HRH07158.1 DinB family protein [Bacteroidia bacterium]